MYFAEYENDYYMHHIAKRSASAVFKPQNFREVEAQYWIANAQKTVATQLQKLPIESTQNFNCVYNDTYLKVSDIALNVILFIGDGMSIPTLTASRIYLGQRQNRTGEETKLSFEDFPYTGLSKVSIV